MRFADVISKVLEGAVAYRGSVRDGMLSYDGSLLTWSSSYGETEYMASTEDITADDWCLI